jgi:hypothetical protein
MQDLTARDVFDPSMYGRFKMQVERSGSPKKVGAVGVSGLHLMFGFVGESSAAPRIATRDGGSFLNLLRHRSLLAPAGWFDFLMAWGLSVWSS